MNGMKTRSVRFIEIRLKISTKLQIVLLHIRDEDAYAYALSIRAKTIQTAHGNEAYLSFDS